MFKHFEKQLINEQKKKVISEITTLKEFCQKTLWSYELIDAALEKLPRKLKKQELETLKQNLLSTLKKIYKSPTTHEWAIIALTGNKQVIANYYENHDQQFNVRVEQYQTFPEAFNPVYYAALSGNMEAVQYCVEGLGIKVAPELVVWPWLPAGPIKNYLIDASRNSQTFLNSKKHAAKLTLTFKPTNGLIANQLADVFRGYAHPPLFSMNWRHGANQKLADQITKYFAQNSNLTADQCLQYIQQTITGKKFNRWGTFQAVIKDVLNKLEAKEPADNNENILSVR